MKRPFVITTEIVIAAENLEHAHKIGGELMEKLDNKPVDQALIKDII